MPIIARRGHRIVLEGEAATWHTNPVYFDLDNELPYTFHQEGGFLAYLTPCCYSFATASDPQWGIYCKKCFNNVPDLCGTGPDRETTTTTGPGWRTAGSARRPRRNRRQP